jgi:hypothetical protein
MFICKNEKKHVFSYFFIYLFIYSYVHTLFGSSLPAAPHPHSLPSIPLEVLYFIDDNTWAKNCLKIFWPLNKTEENNFIFCQ